MKQTIGIRFTALVFVLFASVTLALPDCIFGGSDTFARGRGSGQGNVGSSRANVGLQASQGSPRASSLIRSQTPGSNQPKIKIFLVDDVFEFSVSVHTIQAVSSPGPRQSPKKRIYTPERWVETEHGVLVLEPEHWVEVETERTENGVRE
ncbi:MAG: hypothetical protein ACREQA_10200 [Candidatus Binatia bacterium]